MRDLVSDLVSDLVGDFICKGGREIYINLVDGLFDRYKELLDERLANDRRVQCEAITAEVERKLKEREEKEKMVMVM